MDYSTDGVGFGSGLDWDMTSNQGLTPLVNYNFNLQVEGIYNLPCKSVRVFQRENEYEYLQEGGLNDYVHMLRKPISKPMTFQVERYVGIDMLDPLALGTDLVLPVILMVSRYQGEGDNGVLDLSDSMQRMYTFTGCTVMAKEYGELNAERSGLLVETTTIAYREMLCIDNPSTLSKRKTWSMKKDYKNMERDAERKQAKALMGVNELTKLEMEEKAKMYVDKKVKEIPMHVLEYKGKKVSNTLNSQTHQQEIGIATKNEMAPKEEREKAATRYYIPGSVSRSEYKGSFKNSATVNKDEVRKADMEKQARKGGAEIQKMTSKTEMEEKASRYFLPGSATVAQYSGTVKNSAAVTADEVRKDQMPNREGGATVKEMTSKAEMEKKAKRYFLPKSKSEADYKGSSQQSATVTKDEVRKDQMPNRKGGAEVKEMTSKTELETKAKRYFLTESKSEGDYKGIRQKSATVSKDEVRKDQMPNRKGGAEVKEMTPKTELEAKAKRYFLPESKSEAEYKGSNQKSASVTKDEVRKDQMPNRKGGANIPEMKPTESRKGGANIPEMKPTESRKGGANIPEMKKTEGQRQYLMDQSERQNSYAGTVRASATVNPNEVRKAEMEAKTRLWPKTRSAADVAAFLKK
ncbi:MAG: hypothetical protein SPG09_12410 [Lachnospiraceae bacterium]|nr:hypothetical protein [bacterium]MDY5518390.1 hypothetical protein [Lachnospiraceae bacterium]